MRLRRSLRKELPGAAGRRQERESAAAQRVLAPVGRLCSVGQGSACTSTGENTHPNVFMGPWYLVGLLGLHSTGGTRINHGWTSHP